MPAKKRGAEMAKPNWSVLKFVAKLIGVILLMYFVVITVRATCCVAFTATHFWNQPTKSFKQSYVNEVKTCLSRY